MKLMRQMSVASAFPPDSKLVRTSDQSRFPLGDTQFENQQALFANQNWQRFPHSNHSANESSIQYTGIEFPDTQLEREQIAVDYDPNLPSMAEIDFRVELMTPHSAAAGQTNTSTMVVTNEGQVAISRIEVQDSLDQLRMVVAATPDATLETIVSPQSGTDQKFLHREIQGLLPGDDYRLALSWVPQGGHRQTYRTRVIAHVAVATTTDVSSPEPDQQMSSIPPETVPEKHPALVCDIRYLEKVRVGDDVELEIAVRNTGNTPLHNVQVKIVVPEQLSHLDGKNVIFEAGDLPVRGKNQTVLKMSATQAGDAVNQLQVASAEQIEARGTARILVVEKSDEPAPAPPETIRPKKPLTPVPANKAPQQPVDACCCQQVSASRTVPGTPIP